MEGRGVCAPKAGHRRGLFLGFLILKLKWRLNYLFLLLPYGNVIGFVD